MQPREYRRSVTQALRAFGDAVALAKEVQEMTMTSTMTQRDRLAIVGEACLDVADARIALNECQGRAQGIVALRVARQRLSEAERTLQTLIADARRAHHDE